MPRRRVAPPSHFRQPLNAILSSEGAVRVLRELILQDAALSITVLADRTGMSRFGVRRVLGLLEEAGIVRSVGVGYTALYQIAPDHPMVAVLQALYLAEHQRYHTVLEGIREAAHSLQPEPTAVWLYGSVARGEDGVASDSDLALIVASDDEVEHATQSFRESLRPLGDAQQVSFAVIGLGSDDVRRLAAAQDSFWTALAADARPLYGAAPDVLAAEYIRTPES